MVFTTHLLLGLPAYHIVQNIEHSSPSFDAQGPGSAEAEWLVPGLVGHTLGVLKLFTAGCKPSLDCDALEIFISKATLW